MIVCGREGGAQTCSPGESLAAALNDLLLQLPHALCVLLVSLLAELSNALDKLGGIEVFGHDGQRKTREREVGGGGERCAKGQCCAWAGEGTPEAKVEVGAVLILWVG